VSRLRYHLHTASTRFPGLIVATATLLAIAGGYLYVAHLPIIADRSSLASRDLEINRRYDDYQREFQTDHRLLVLVVRAAHSQTDGALPVATAAERREMKKLASRWASALREQPELFRNVVERIAPEQMGGSAALYLPLETVTTIGTLIEGNGDRISATLEAPSWQDVFTSARRMLSELSPPDSADGTRRIRVGIDLGESILATLRSQLDADADTLDLDSIVSELGSSDVDLDGFFFSGDGRLLTAFANVIQDVGIPNPYERVVDAARRALEASLSEVAPEVSLSAGLAGLPTLEFEEMQTSRRDFSRGAVITLVLVSLLFMWGFGSVLRPALAALCLCMSIGITFGITWLVIGHMNMLGLVFAVILLALGVDFAIHLYTHYQVARAGGLDTEAAIRAAYSGVGGALWMSGLTTAGAFLSAYFTEFPGLSELGLIAGSGLLVCLTLMYFAFPALLYLVDSRSKRIPIGVGLQLRAHLPKRVVVGSPVSRRARGLIAAAAMVSAVGFAFGQYHFDANLLNLQPVEGEANRWQQVLLTADDRTSFALLTYEDRSELDSIRTRLEALPAVRGAEAVFPSRESEKRSALAATCSLLSGIAVQEPGRPSVVDTRRALFGLRQQIRRFSRNSDQAQEVLSGLETGIGDLYTTLGGMDERTAVERLESAERRLEEAFRDLLARLTELSCPAAVTLDSAPEPIRKRFVGSDGSLAMAVYPAKNAWDRNNLEEFVEAVRDVDPRVFGGIVNFFENGNAMIRSFIEAAAYSFFSILVLLGVWLRSPRAVSLALFPLVSSIGMLLGIMRLWPGDLVWNFANFFAIPILIGVGVAGGIHIVRAWQSGSLDAFRGATRAVAFSSITTLIGFGVLATSDHLGVASLGLILSIGIVTNLGSCLVLLPILLKMFDLQDFQKTGT
jgi:hopanoid biosynthesis associated RND transporter like protein HpnN